MREPEAKYLEVSEGRLYNWCFTKRLLYREEEEEEEKEEEEKEEKEEEKEEKKKKVVLSLCKTIKFKVSGKLFQERQNNLLNLKKT